MSELKTAKDSLVASLFELSKAAQDAAAATVNFYKLVGDDSVPDPSDALQSLGETLRRISEIDTDAIHGGVDGIVDGVDNNHAVAALAEQAAAAAAAAGVTTTTTDEKPKRKKAERDPNAPKKPLTIYFAFSFHTREEIRDQRKKEGKPALSAIDMNELVKDKWNNISKEEKEYWQKKYANELKAYQKEKEKYKLSLEGAQAAQQALASVHVPDQSLNGIVASQLPGQLHDHLGNTLGLLGGPDKKSDVVKKPKEKKRKVEKSDKPKAEKKAKKAA